MLWSYFVFYRYHGRGERFIPATGRDPALVNKACDFLKAHHLVPPFWRQDKNKGMIRSPDGRWMQPEREKLDDHSHDIPHYLDRLGLVENHESWRTIHHFNNSNQLVIWSVAPESMIQISSSTTEELIKYAEKLKNLP